MRTDTAEVANQIQRMPIDEMDVSQPALFQDDTIGLYFDRLRREAPVHYCASSRFGPYWSITRFNDIMHVDTRHQVFSSDAHNGGIQIVDFPKGLERVNFINMDPPEHDAKRKVISPIVAPANLAQLDQTIRAHVADILDGLPREATFDWVETVSVELTTRMLATLFAFPFEDRRLLTWWSDVAVMDLTSGGEIDSEEKRLEALQPCFEYFMRLFHERKSQPPGIDLISMLAHSPHTKDMDAKEFLGTLILLIVGGNDTTRNSISGGLLALNDNPDEWRKLRADPGLVSKFIPEIIRWQTPLAHMRRTTTQDTEVAGQAIPAGSKVIMWYLSGNRDPEAIPEPDRFMVDRERPRQHLSFGFGVHRCVGNRLAEMQLTILWQEILARGLQIDVVGTPTRTFSNIIHGFTEMPVRVAA